MNNTGQEFQRNNLPNNWMSAFDGGGLSLIQAVFQIY